MGALLGNPTNKVKGVVLGYPAPPLLQRRIFGGMSDIGRILKERREALNIKQVDAAVYAGISRSHLSKIEAGDDPASFAVIFMLSVLYNIELATLLPEDHPLHNAALVNSPDEKEVLHRYRDLPEDERRLFTKLLVRGDAA